jgi:hypothetical protein
MVCCVGCIPCCMMEKDAGQVAWHHDAWVALPLPEPVQGHAACITAGRGSRTIRMCTDDRWRGCSIDPQPKSAFTSATFLKPAPNWWATELSRDWASSCTRAHGFFYSINTPSAPQFASSMLIDPDLGATTDPDSTYQHSGALCFSSEQHDPHTVPRPGRKLKVLRLPIP